MSLTTLPQLGWSLVILFCFSFATALAAGDESPEALPSTTLTVSPLYVFPGQAATDTSEAIDPRGECGDYELTIGGFPPGRIRIGVIESQLGGASRLWNATTWQAALTASQILNYEPRATQVTLALQGRIDGPSAGALLTVGVLAGALGHSIDPEMTMTGTINPDGVIGPVGGIPYKIEGAARAGKKVVLIPRGMPREFDQRIGEPIDLVEHGKKLGVEVRLVDDIWAAYREFTGKSLPRSRDTEPPALRPGVSDHLESEIDRWLAYDTSSRKKYEAWGERGQNDYADSLFEAAAECRTRADRLRQQGQHAAAYFNAQWCAINATVGHQVGRCEYLHAGQGLPAVREMLADEGWITSEIEKLESALKFFRPATLEQLPYYLLACDQYTVGLSLRDIGKALAAELPDDEEAATLAVVNAAERQALAWMSLKLAYSYLELGNLQGGQPIPPGAPLEELTELYLRSAEANQSVVDEIVITRVARAANITPETAKSRLAVGDPFYGINFVTMNSIYPSLDKVFGDSEQLRYARLATAISLNSRSAMLIAKHYSLRAELNDECQIVDVQDEPALIEWLDDSRSQARRAIRGLVDAGIDCTSCVQLYSIARIDEATDLDSRLGALQSYFDINVTAQVLQRIARGTSPPIEKAP